MNVRNEWSIVTLPLNGKNRIIALLRAGVYKPPLFLSSQSFEIKFSDKHVQFAKYGVMSYELVFYLSNEIFIPPQHISKQIFGENLITSFINLNTI